MGKSLSIFSVFLFPRVARARRRIQGIEITIDRPQGKNWRKMLCISTRTTIENYFFNCFSLCFLLFSSLSFLVIGFFLLLPMLNAITTLKYSEWGIKFLRLEFSPTNNPHPLSASEYNLISNHLAGKTEVN